jgi:UDP-N-acetylglucosamine 4,6-dehydratase
MFENSTILLTGGTGSFGHAFTQMVLEKHKPKKLIILSRDEMKQWNMSKLYKDPRLRFFIGDVRDRERLYRAFNGVDYIVHAAAGKIVPLAEYNPFEYIKTNVNGAMNVIDAAIDNNVKKVIALSTDKASSPVNLYGATKLVSDKLFISGNSSYSTKTVFSVVRYGNVVASRGSVIPFFREMSSSGKIPITDKEMTRFFITVEDAVKLVLFAIKDSIGGEIYIKKIPSIKITDLARAIAPEAKQEIVGIRPGEKIHEQMMAKEEAYYSYEYKDYYKILPYINKWYLDKKRIKDGKKVPPDFTYSSDKNKEWISGKVLTAWLKKN